MSKIDDGGPAFPHTTFYDEKPTDSEGGMSLRDYFAAHAPPPPPWWLKSYDPCWAESPDLATAAKHDAAWRYEWADAMLIERRKDGAG